MPSASWGSRFGWAGNSRAGQPQGLPRASAFPRTGTSIEAGSPGTSIANVLNAAVVVGVRLFGADHDELAIARRHGD